MREGMTMTISNIERLQRVIDGKYLKSNSVPECRDRRESDCDCDLYRYFSAEGSLLYVGITFDFMTRAEYHAKWSLWWPMARYAHVETFPSRFMALGAERRAIHDEEPIHNSIRKIPPTRPAGPDMWFFEKMGRKWIGEESQWWRVTECGLDPLPAEPAPAGRTADRR